MRPEPINEKYNRKKYHGGDQEDGVLLKNIKKQDETRNTEIESNRTINRCRRHCSGSGDRCVQVIGEKKTEINIHYFFKSDWLYYVAAIKYTDAQYKHLIYKFKIVYYVLCTLRLYSILNSNSIIDI